MRYISHPEVHIDAAVPVPEWSLNEVGTARAVAMLDQPWVPPLCRVISSPEVKARETAGPLARYLGLGLDIRRATHEIDRSATGYVSHERHEELANRLFAEPAESADGWETARDAQQRTVAALADVIDGRHDGDTAVVGHGGVGTLLLCHLARLEIDRSLDQPGGGHFWTYDTTSAQILHHWLPIDQRP